MAFGIPIQGRYIGFTGVIFIYRGYCFIYREVPLHCATKIILTCGFKTRRERALKAQLLGDGRLFFWIA